jgi:ribosomal protein S12 methylthiotransferase accessory factor
MDAVIGSVDGSVRFFGLTPTSMKLEGLDRHQRLIDSYETAQGAGSVCAGVLHQRPDAVACALMMTAWLRG